MTFVVTLTGIAANTIIVVTETPPLLRMMTTDHSAGNRTSN